MGWGDLGQNGNPYLSTPSLDSLAYSGASFTNFYVQPVCSPTRAEILTGMYYPRSGVTSTSAGGERIASDQILLSEVFKKAGYKTGYFGKWHSGTQHPYHPLSRGFDEFYGFTSGHWGQYFNPSLDHNGHTVIGDGYLADDLAQKTKEFIEEQIQPFLAVLAFNTPHSPMQVPDQWWDDFKNVEVANTNEKTTVNHTRAAYAMIENLDWNVGTLLHYLDASDKRNNTIVIFLSDNGPNGHRWNDELKGIKGSTDEGGVKSPLLISWPNQIERQIEVSTIASSIDLFPTLLGLCQIEQPTFDLDGYNFNQLLRSNDVSPQDRMLVQHWNKKTSVRSKQYRMDSEGLLFDIESDPGQMNDLSFEKPEILNKLRQRKSEWLKAMTKGEEEVKTETFTIGHSITYADYLPARDGLPVGSIQRSNRYPNDSYFRNWTKSTDSIIWNIDVLSEGTYEFSIDYTCSKEHLGSEIIFEIDMEQIPFSFKEAFESELEGHDHDRVRRIESYTKKFRTQKLGMVQLAKGISQIRLYASDIISEEVGDVKGLKIQKKPSQNLQ